MLDHLLNDPDEPELEYSNPRHVEKVVAAQSKQKATGWGSPEEAAFVKYMADRHGGAWADYWEKHRLNPANKPAQPASDQL